MVDFSPPSGRSIKLDYKSSITGGEWISAPPIDGTLVVNIGQAFEVATEGWCPATIHEVVSPQNGKERFLVPFFQGIDLNIGVGDLKELVRGAEWEEVCTERIVRKRPLRRESINGARTRFRQK
jgi:isopenicillin N synthase-like dioxygenase